MPSVLIGVEERERIEIQGNGYERAPVGEFFDDNWVRVVVAIAVGGFSGKYAAAFLTSDFVGFHEELQALHRSLEGKASFSTMEEQLSLELTRSGRGGHRVERLRRGRAGLRQSPRVRPSARPRPSGKGAVRAGRGTECVSCACWLTCQSISHSSTRQFNIAGSATLLLGTSENAMEQTSLFV